MNMAKFKISNFFIYRWRNVIGYSLVAIGLILILIFISLYLPGGITNAEIQSVIKSNSINMFDYWSMNVINLPYHLLQHTSFFLFGVTIFSIKLPSIILAFLSIIGLTLLLRQWFNPNIGILATLIAITTGQLLFIAQSGTSEILYLFWPVWILLLASLIPISNRFRKIYIAGFVALASLSLYTPLSIYVLLVIAGAIILHPHLRYYIKQLTKIELIGGSALILILVAPLLIAIYKSPNLILTLFGLPNIWPNIIDNLVLLANQYLNFANPGGSTIFTPFFELGSILVILLGIYFVIKTKFTAKSYIVILWILLLTPIIIINPSFTFITFLPLVILLASGLNGLLAHWYELFPRNPYARISGLVPIIILVSVLVIAGTNRYIYEYRYNPNIVPNFSQDIQLIPSSSTNIVVADNELAFYQIIAKYDKKLVISTVPSGETMLVSRAASKPLAGYTISKIITSPMSEQSDRFYLYTKSI